ncbi:MULTISPECIES: flagellar biosynthesis protein FlhB [unclassified Campylobacter]|uniref:flagellar biosynthesis protein FlhB n=1 Tax=unclassified Campylobacter TaxID=2593542 RepID=UPI001BD9973D|nr:flagellar biosynthesis protein FlhB [Campylobacter sp. RM12651]MBT0881247.1 flagellar biosynthesis protein FlhB [Campylobacter sp. 2018MI27]MBT0881820.1 flagellar biosynthesis protein FlhB [Campylobacter sp. 2018MI13]MBT0884581.1 flagellar biosynthesis protein FlhB [Campylobacter sp. 2018MI10]MBZ7976328.1 flagellar biosynthesis protein FlhB [Campylobacter sp. RM12637]MBZ7992898.1 flagellar biosynthesis protein FlhB [Campylobacter sp. RM9333]
MMADDAEKTEEPTDKKIEDARKEGNVAKSQDVAALITLCVGFGFALFWVYFLHERITALYIYYQSLIGSEIDNKLLYKIGIKTLLELTLMVLPLAIAIAIAGIIANVMQIGFNFTLKPIMPNFGKINPIKGIKNIISMKKLIELVKIILKVSVIFGIVGYFIYSFLPGLSHLAILPLIKQMEWLRDKIIILFAAVICSFLVFGILDIFIVRFQYFKGLRMSKQEIKDEYKQMEGDPQVKAKIRQIQMQAARNRMMQDVPNADVVITNPTHYSIAIAYDRTKHKAPVVLAKGVDNIAFKIREIAQKHDIPIYEQRELARSLYKICEVGDEIPVELYKATAEVLGVIARMSRR